MRTIVIFVLIGLIGFSACQQNKKQTNVEAPGQETTQPETLPDLSIYHLPGSWHTQNNDTIKLADLQGKITVLVMIYTSCPYACPRLVEDMKIIERQLPQTKLNQVNFVLVSIDPETDTPEKLKQFSKDHELNNQHWTLLQGTPGSVLELAATLGVKYKKTTPKDFSHSNIISVFNRVGELVHQEEGLGTDHSKTIEVINEML